MLGRELPLMKLFQHPTIEALAQVVEEIILQEIESEGVT